MSDPLAAFSSAPPRRHNQSNSATAPATGADTSLSGRWTSLFRGSISPSIDVLKTRAVEGVIAREDVASLRWIQWKLFLTEHISSIPSSWSAILERDRGAYNELRCRLLRAPDGNYPPEVGFDGTHTTLGSTISSSPRQIPHGAQARSAVVNDLSVNNPLSLDDSNPWKTYYTTLETRRLILQDVERTFPDLPLFRRTNVQQSLTNILFLWTLQNEDEGYRQGMHELAAVLWKVRSDGAIDYQRVSASNPASVDVPFHQALADVFIEHDVYTLFCTLMQSAKDWYAWQTNSKATAVAASSSVFVRSPSNARQSEDTTPPKLPIVVKCEHIMDLLRYIDPALAQHLESLGIEPQLYCLRWIRMIFTREFALDDALTIWDGLFATGDSLSLVDDVCIAMLLRIRNQLLSGDHTSALQCLLRYPQEAQAQPSLLIKQAVFLRDNGRQPSTGVAVVMQNRDLLGIAVRSINDTNADRSPGQSGSASPAHRQSTQKFATVGRTFAGPAARPPPWDRLRDDSLARNAGSQQARSEIRRLRPAAAAAGDPLGALQGPASTVDANAVDANGPRAFGINPTAYLPEGISDMAKGWYERAELPQTLNSALASVSRTVAAAASAYASAKPETSGFPSGFEQAFNSQTGPRSAATASTVGHAASNRKARPSLSGRGVAETTGSPQPTQPTLAPPKKSYDELAGQLAKLMTANKTIGSALSACIGVLEQSWLDQAKDNDAQRTQELEQRSLNTLMSFTALKHIRDVLDGTATEFDPATLPTSALNAPVSNAGGNETYQKQDDCSATSSQQASKLETEAKETAAQQNRGKSFHPTLPMSLAEYARYGRQMILPDFGLPGQLRLRRAKVLVVGAGGLGCPAVQYLAAAGVGQISILDHDVVEPSNLARQILHSDATVGIHKAVSAAKAAKQINPYIDAVPISEAISAANARQMMRGQDLVLDCTDNPLTRYLISDAAVLEGVQVVSGAAQGYDGQLVVLHKRIKPEFAGPKGAAVAKDGSVRGPCYRCLFPKAPRPDEVANCEDGGVLGGITGLVGTMQALESVKILAGIGEETPPTLTLVSPLTSSPFRSVKIRPRRIATCRSCGDPAQVAEPMITDLEQEDYLSFCGLNVPPSGDGGLPRTAARAIDPKALVVDVRPTVEYGITKLDGSLNLPIQTVMRKPQDAWETIYEAAEKMASSSILVVCKKGNDSRLAVKALLQEQQKEQAQKAAQKPSSKASSHPLEAEVDTQVQEVRSRTVLPVSDLIGGLRAYLKKKDPNFPVY